MLSKIEASEMSKEKKQMSALLDEAREREGKMTKAKERLVKDHECEISSLKDELLRQKALMAETRAQLGNVKMASGEMERLRDQME